MAGGGMIGDLVSQVQQNPFGAVSNAVSGAGNMISNTLGGAVQPMQSTLGSVQPQTQTPPPNFGGLGPTQTSSVNSGDYLGGQAPTQPFLQTMSQLGMGGTQQQPTPDVSPTGVMPTAPQQTTGSVPAYQQPQYTVAETTAPQQPQNMIQPMGGYNGRPYQQNPYQQQYNPYQQMQPNYRQMQQQQQMRQMQQMQQAQMMSRMGGYNQQMGGMGGYGGYGGGMGGGLGGLLQQLLGSRGGMGGMGGGYGQPMPYGQPQPMYDSRNPMQGQMRNPNSVRQPLSPSEEAQRQALVQQLDRETMGGGYGQPMPYGPPTSLTMPYGQSQQRVAFNPDERAGITPEQLRAMQA